MGGNETDELKVECSAKKFDLSSKIVHSRH